MRRGRRVVPRLARELLGRFHVVQNGVPRVPLRADVSGRNGSWVQALETRVLFSFDPSPREQELFELLNRLRLNPADELPLLLDSGDESIEQALEFFGVDRDVLAGQWSQLEPAPPVTWNEDLSEAALFHNEQMLAADEQSHQAPGEPSLRQRVTDAGYTTNSAIGENVFAFTESILHGHAGFAIDWGFTDTGIQDPPGHRNTMMDPAYREVGISVIDSAPDKDVGPMLVTQDFGGPTDPGDVYFLGVLYDDLNDDGFYTAGEGIAGADITITTLDEIGQVYHTTSLSAGGYQIALPVGLYRIDITSEAFEGVITFDLVNIENQNLKIDATPDLAVGGGPGETDEQPPVAALDGAFSVIAGRTDARFMVRVSDPGGLDEGTLGDAIVRLQGPKGVDLDLSPDAIRTSGDATSATLTYRFSAPGGFWNADDSGDYVLTLSNAADVSGNVATDAAVGTFPIKLSPRRTPTVTLDAEPLREPGRKFHRIQVEYFSRNRIDVGTISRNDIIVTSPDGEELTVKFIELNAETDGKRRVATYRITAPSRNAWKPGDNGRYKVHIRAHAIRDADGNYVPPGKAGSFKVNVPTPSKRKSKPKPKAKANLAAAMTLEPPKLFSSHRVHQSLWQLLNDDQTTR